MLYGSVYWSFNFKDMLSLRKLLNVCLLACFNVWSICAAMYRCMQSLWQMEVNFGCRTQSRWTFIFKTISHWIWSSSIQYGWLASEFQGSAYQPLLTLNYEVTNTIPYLTFDFIVRYPDPGPHTHCLCGGLSWTRHFPRSLSDYQWKQYDYIYTFIKQPW